MLDELKNLRYQGGKDELLFFLYDVIGHREIRIRDIETICSHAPGGRFLSAADLLNYCHALGWIEIDADIVSLSSSIVAYVSDKDTLNDKLIRSTVEQLFVWETFNSSMFFFDVMKGCYSFRNELLPLHFSVVRNVLISQGFLIVVRDNQGVKFYIAQEYDSVVAQHCKTKRKQFSLEQLRKQLEDNELAGEKAELFVLSFEKNRIGQPLCEEIKRISEIDTSAGYDIVSFNTRDSVLPDRFIEVKAVSNTGFYWSRNEYEVAKLKGTNYYLYLVELNCLMRPDYCPLIVQNPAIKIMESDSWFVQAESYFVKRV